MFRVYEILDGDVSAVSVNDRYDLEEETESVAFHPAF